MHRAARQFGFGFARGIRLQSQRAALLKLWRSDAIGDDVLTRLEREIDLAEARLAGNEAD